MTYTMQTLPVCCIYSDNVQFKEVLTEGEENVTDSYDDDDASHRDGKNNDGDDDDNIDDDDYEFSDIGQTPEQDGQQKEPKWTDLKLVSVQL